MSFASHRFDRKTNKKDFWPSLQKELESKIFIKNVNPKTTGLFGQLDNQGVEPTHFGKHTLTPPNFIPKQQTGSHMKAALFS